MRGKNFVEYKSGLKISRLWQAFHNIEYPTTNCQKHFGYILLNQALILFFCQVNSKVLEAEWAKVFYLFYVFLIARYPTFLHMFLYGSLKK